MPRLSHSLLIRAYSKSPYLPLILRTTRGIDSAVNELRWMKEHVEKSTSNGLPWPRISLLALCKRRERGEPLQFIIGTQPFGELDIKCRAGVLIPRPETEAYTIHLAQLIDKGRLSETPKWSYKSSHTSRKSSESNQNTTLKILDACSGSGCISLLLYSQLAAKFSGISIQGWDISPKAITLARENLGHNIREKALPKTAESQVSFLQADILHTPEYITPELDDFDIVISNPPYISQQHFWKETTRSVRNWEPRLALVPGPKQQLPHQKTTEHPEDVFYHRLVQVFGQSQRCKALVMEVGDDEQAKRVAELALFSQIGLKVTRTVEIWRDFLEASDISSETIQLGGFDVEVKGSGMMRSVVVFANDTAQ